ncbi:APC family permease [Thermomonospora amylolytica]|uniref:APC family permease n=1 Tax=Thermomonospora amylolytica TaxID=1411117 RepID=UPI000E6D17B9|nr:APC family permease [Thermomonospora amylolytica]
MTHRTADLGVLQGTALLLGGVLGPGALVLPHLAAAAAGPASIAAWAGLLALSVPVALTFAALGSRHPDGGGAAAFTGLAFGERASAVVGWWFYFCVPAGIVAGALIGGEYVAAALGLDAAGLLACLLLGVAFAANAAGLRTSGGLQVGLVGLLAALLVAAVALAAPHTDAGNFTPFAPHGAGGVARAVGVLLFAFAGWEAASHLSADFADRRRGLRRATAVTLVVVGVLYLGLAVTTIGLLGERAAVTGVPLTELLAAGIGDAARPVTGAAAVLLSLGAINTFIAGAARLGVALARDGALPARLTGGPAPARSLASLAVLTGALLPPVLLWNADLDVLMRVTSACLAAVTVAGTAAAVRLLPRGAARRTAVAATVFGGAALLCCGAYLLVPLALAVAALLPARRSSPEAASNAVAAR